MTARQQIGIAGAIRKQIVESINGLSQADLQRLGAWDALTELSKITRFEAIDADPDSIEAHGDGAFDAAATIYVTLGYGDGGDAETFGEEYPAIVYGHVDGSITIDRVVVDTSSFYR